MSRLYTLLLCLLFTIHAQAQYSYQPFPTENASWMYHSTGVITDSTTGHTYLQYMIGSDTVFQGLTYKKVMRRMVYFNLHKDSVLRVPGKGAGEDDYFGALRETGKKIYYKQGGSPFDMILFDFTKEAGDTIEIGGGLAVVTSIDTVFTANRYRRQFNLKAVVWNPPASYTEGFGGVGGIFPTGLNNPGAGQSLYFNCYSHNDEVYSEKEGCMYMFPYDTPTGIPNTQSTSHPSAYPNPFINEMHVAAQAGSRILLYNSSGAKVVDAIANGKPLETAALNCGVYLLLVLSKEGQVVQQQKMVK